MRKLLAIGMALGVTLGLVTAASASVPVKKKPPVKLDGKVTNKGTKTVKDDKITIEVEDFFYKATFLKAKPGTTVTVTLDVKGSAPHTFTAEDGSFDEDLSSGDEVTVEVAIPDSGDPVAFFCNFHGDQGMKGAFFTKKGSKAGTTGGSTATTGGTTPTSGDDDSGLGYGY